MKKVRVIWAFWIILMVSAVIFTDNLAIPIIAVLSIILPVIGMLLAACSAGGLTATVQGAVSVPKGGTISCSLDVTNNGRWSCARGKAVLDVQNIFTGEREERVFNFSVTGKKIKHIVTEIPAKTCGMVKVQLKSLESHDFIGAYNRAVPIDGTAQTLVIPATYSIEMELGTGSQMDIDSDEYSQLKSGFDPSETFALREYRTGDNLKNIHWKLSEKLDELIVRELGLPINNTVLILLDTSYVDEMKEGLTPSIIDAIGETVISISQQLCFMKLSHQIGWYDSQNSKIWLREVTKADQLSGIMASLLSQGPEYDEAGIAERFIEEYGKPEYAHLIIIGAREETMINEDFSDGIVTNLVCSRTTDRTYAADGGQVIYFTPETMEKDLLYIEV